MLTKSEKENIPKYKNNPLSFSNEKVEILEEAYTILVKIIDKYVQSVEKQNNQENELNLEQYQQTLEAIANAKKTIDHLYKQKKAGYFLQSRLDHFNVTLKEAFDAISENHARDSKEKPASSLYYLKRRFSLNE